MRTASLGYGDVKVLHGNWQLYIYKTATSHVLAIGYLQFRNEPNRRGGCEIDAGVAAQSTCGIIVHL